MNLYDCVYIREIDGPLQHLPQSKTNSDIFQSLLSAGLFAPFEKSTLLIL